MLSIELQLNVRAVQCVVQWVLCAQQAAKGPNNLRVFQWDAVLWELE